MLFQVSALGGQCTRAVLCESKVHDIHSSIFQALAPADTMHSLASRTPQLNNKSPRWLQGVLLPQLHCLGKFSYCQIR